MSEPCPCSHVPVRHGASERRPRSKRSALVSLLHAPQPDLTRMTPRQQQQHEPSPPWRLGILLPITSRSTSAAAVLSGLQLLASSLAAAPADNTGVDTSDTSVFDMAVLLGVDCDDTSLLEAQRQLEGAFEGAPGVSSVHTRVFSTEELRRRSRQGDTNTDRGSRGSSQAGGRSREAGREAGNTGDSSRDAADSSGEAGRGGRAAGRSGREAGDSTVVGVCRLWELLAQQAVEDLGCQLIVLLGDDTTVSPPGWPQLAVRAFINQPNLVVALLHDNMDPGFPSFFVMRGDVHLGVFGGRLFPEGAFINQGGDPYIAELWRRVGGLGMLRGIHVTNAVGGVQRSGQAYQPPRYERSTVPQLAMQALLSDSTLKLRQRIRDAIHFPPVSVSVRPMSGGMAACHDAPCASPAATACCAAQPLAADLGAAQAGQTRGPLAPGQGADCAAVANAASRVVQGRGAGEQLPPAEVLRQLQPDALSQVGTRTADTPQRRCLENPGDGTTGQQGVASCYSYAAQCAAQGGVTAMGPLPPEEVLQQLQPDTHNRSGSQLGTNPAAAEAQCAAQDRGSGGPLPPEEVLQQLQPDGLSLDVLVPCYRLDPAVLTVMEQRVRSCTHPSLTATCPKLIIVVDRPAPNASELDFMDGLQHRLLHQARIRRHEVNQGAAATRNSCLDESLAEAAVFFDDDVHPSECCLDAYASAFKEHPQAAGFAGPTYLPRHPDRCWQTAMHMSDMSWFWEAPVRLKQVPWAVTANTAVRATGVRFGSGFPRTGGGEDIDFCLRAAPCGMVAVPQASAVHPWWHDGRRDYRRFFGWAYGDGQLADLYPQYSYRAAPGAVDLCLALGALCLALGTLAAALLLVPTCALAMLLVLPRGLQLLLAVGLQGGAAGGASCSTPCAPAQAPPSPQFFSLLFHAGCRHCGFLACSCLEAAWALCRAVLAVALCDVALDVLRNCCQQERRSQHPCVWWLRPLAACEASLIKSISEAGRIWGHARRGRLSANVCRRWDWFCGLQPGVVRAEQRRALLRCAVLVAAAVLAASWREG